MSSVFDHGIASFAELRCRNGQIFYILGTIVFTFFIYLSISCCILTFQVANF
uniref:Uncharacterized protein n=1 Tax=Arundo donax TaxID=35708 RepID=A0A0A9HN00_ARUDO